MYGPIVLIQGSPPFVILKLFGDSENIQIDAFSEDGFDAERNAK